MGEIGSGATIYIPPFIKIGSGIRKMMGEGGIHKHKNTNSMVIS
jgi:hypothetical protein